MKGKNREALEIRDRLKKVNSYILFEQYVKKALALGFKRKTFEKFYGKKLEYEFPIFKAEDLVEKILRFNEGQWNKFKVDDPAAFYLLLSKKQFYVKILKNNIVHVKRKK